MTTADELTAAVQALVLDHQPHYWNETHPVSTRPPARPCLAPGCPYLCRTPDQLCPLHRTTPTDHTTEETTTP